jgi:hypothetical protein
MEIYIEFYRNLRRVVRCSGTDLFRPLSEVCHLDEFDDSHPSSTVFMKITPIPNSVKIQDCLFADTRSRTDGSCLYVRRIFFVSPVKKA